MRSRSARPGIRHIPILLCSGGRDRGAARGRVERGPGGRGALPGPRATAALRSLPSPTGCGCAPGAAFPSACPALYIRHRRSCPRTLRAERRGDGCAAAGEGSPAGRAPIPFVGLVSGCEAGGAGRRAWKTRCHAAGPAAAPHVASRGVLNPREEREASCGLHCPGFTARVWV